MVKAIAIRIEKEFCFCFSQFELAIVIVEDTAWAIRQTG